MYRLLLGALCIALLMSCTHRSEIIGRWQEIGKAATLEFRRDSTFKAVDDMGMAVSGKYTIEKDGNIRFEIKHTDATTEIINGTHAVHGDELTYTSENDKEVYKYKRAQ